MPDKTVMTIKINLRKLAHRFMESNKKILKVSDIAFELGISNTAAGKILSALERLGYVEKWSDKVYILCDIHSTN